MSDRSRDSKIWIQQNDVVEIQNLLSELGWISPEDSVQAVEKAGDGNMNLTLRVTTEQRSLIVKQSRPWVEKYPSIDAPVERALYEQRFYQAIQSNELLRERMPRILGISPDRFLMAIEDLGTAKDCSSLYQQQDQVDQEIENVVSQVTQWLAYLHELPTEAYDRTQFDNAALKSLNHQYMYVLPFSNKQGIELDEVLPGLESIAEPIRRNDQLRSAASKLGQRYLRNDGRLIHGDFFPGSWLATSSGIKIIDPEFCHCGDPEFDLAVMLAHTRMTFYSKDPLSLIQSIYESSLKIDWELVEQFAAVEIIRRLIGLAQLPLEINLETRQKLVETATARLT